MLVTSEFEFRETVSGSPPSPPLACPIMVPAYLMSPVLLSMVIAPVGVTLRVSSIDVPVSGIMLMVPPSKSVESISAIAAFGKISSACEFSV